MNNVESAAAADDNYDLRHILLADGIGAVVGAFLGSPFPPAVYIGHPGWKAIGGRIGYSLATGVGVGLVCFLGPVALLLAVIPLVAVLPILLYIGVVITAQAFEATPIRHAPAIVLALVPNLAAWAQNLVDSALNAAGTSAAKVGPEALGRAGLVYDGMAMLGGGAILAGMVLGAITAFVITLTCPVFATHTRIVSEEGQDCRRDLTGCERKLTPTDGESTVTVELFVNGTLMRGLALHHNLAGAEFLGEFQTAPCYRIYSIDDRHPGMFELSEGEEGGISVPGELYRMPDDVWARVEAGEPPILYKAPVKLADGRTVDGILYPRELAEGHHRDISEYGSWRAYIAARDRNEP